MIETLLSLVLQNPQFIFSATFLFLLLLGIIVYLVKEIKEKNKDIKQLVEVIPQLTETNLKTVHALETLKMEMEQNIHYTSNLNLKELALKTEELKNHFSKGVSEILKESRR